MNVKLLLADPQDPAAMARAVPLQLQVLQTAPGGEDVTVTFRPDRTDDLRRSAKQAAQLAYHILFREGVVRSQLVLRCQVPGSPANVVGRSADLAFALAILLHVYAQRGQGAGCTPAYTAIAATGVLDVDGAVRAVEHVPAKLRAALSGPDSQSVEVFFPADNVSEVERAGLLAQYPNGQLRPIRHLDEALEHLGIVLDRVYLRNPFRGLKHFDYEHHSIFFGRDTEVHELLRQLLRRESAGKPGALVEGPSGSGKSSFLRAGVLPALVNPQDQPPEVCSAIKARPVSTETRRAIWRPGLMTFGMDEAGLVHAIRECWAAYTEWPDGWRTSPTETLEQLARARRAFWPATRRFVWLIDQFEEIFTLGLPDDLLEALGRFLAQSQVDGVWTLASIRADAVAQLKQHSALREVFGADEGQYYLASLRGLALDDVISLPAKAADLTFGTSPEGKRLDQLLRDEAYLEQDSLPLLQFTLNELYLRRSGQELTYAAYRQLGGLSGSIANTADTLLRAQSAQSQRALPRLFRNLVSVDESGRASRRYASLTDIGRDLLQKELVARLVEARLCVTDERNGESVVAFAHDSLLRTLPTLTEWLKEEGALLQTRELAQREARLWQQHGKSTAWLASADKLVAFKRLDVGEIALAADVRTFLDRSELHAQRTRRIKQAAVCLIALLAIATSIGAWIATRKQREAEYQTTLTRKAQMRLLTEAAAERLKDGDIAYASGIILEVLRHGGSLRQPDPAAVNVFQEVRASDAALAILVGHEDPVRRAEYSPDGKYIVTASMDATARIWDARTGVPLRMLLHHGGSVNTATYSPDGMRILTASSDHTARVWDASTGRELAVLREEERVTCAVYSPDGSRIATLSAKSLRIWDARTGALLSTVASPGVTFGSPNGDAGYRGTAAYAPDGTRIVTTMGDRTARIWDARTGSMLAVLSGHTESMATVAYSPDGKHIVTAGDTTARIWDAVTGQPQLVLAGHAGYVWSAVYSPDGTMIATASTDKTARIWDATSGTQLRVLSGDVNILCAAAYSPDGSYLVTAGWDRTARTWNLRGPNALILTGHSDQVGTVRYSPDGGYLVTTSMDKTARIWDTRTHAPVVVLRDDHDAFNSAVYSPDGAHIVTASNDNSARIWDLRTRTPVAILSGPGAVLSATYSPNGGFVVGAFRNQTFGLWDAHTGVLGPPRAGHRDTISSVVFSPDGSKILTASVDKTVRIWNARTLTPLKILQHNDFINMALFSPDGAHLVSAVDDSTARIWDARTGEQTGILSGHHSFVYSAAFSPDGTRIVTSSKDKTVRLWEVRTGTQLAVLLGHDGEVFDVTYSPDGQHVASASADKTVRIWDARISAEFPAQVVWEEAAQADALSGAQRMHLGLAPTTALLADMTIQSYAQPVGRAPFPRSDATACDRQTAAFYDPERRTQGVELDRIDPDLAMQACAPLITSARPSARALYESGRALLLKADFIGAQRAFERALSRGYRSAHIDLAQLLTNPQAQMLDPARAVLLYEQAWRQGDFYAGFELGQLYEQGVSTANQAMIFPQDPGRAWRWYQAAAAAHEPHALARYAQQDESAALKAHSTREASTLLLQAFGRYAQAARLASAEDWPDFVWRGWRYRRASLARILAAEDLMQEVADTYTRVLE